MGELKYLLKFGKREHLESLTKGTLFCSNAITFWGIEKDLKVKGQGVILEAGSKIFSQRMLAQEIGTDKIALYNVPMQALVHYEPAEKIPVYCMFAITEGDCIIDDNGNYHIKLLEATKETIKNHFPNADSVAIVKKPYKFLDEIKNSINCRIEHDFVHYFNIDNGYTDENVELAKMDMEYMQYLTQDVPPIVEDGKKTYRFLADYVYRALLCKDIFFKNEQEYRIVLPDEQIEESTDFKVNITEKIDIISLSDFWICDQLP